MHYSAHIICNTGDPVIGPLRSTPLNALKKAIKIGINSHHPKFYGPKRCDIYEHRTIIHRGIETIEEAIANIETGQGYDHYNRYSQNGNPFLTVHGQDNQDLIDQVRDLMSRNKRRYT